ncbi:MAG TPA: Fe-S cluster assembly protein SufD [Acetobacteraceae bacterium]|nr:Fe-S cluster assembly protein SufD [Acetobacteraceae bacterium]
MNAITETGTAGLLARYEALRGSLPGDPALRDAAARAFRSLGLPGASRGRRSEAWKYTSLAPVADMSFGIDHLPPGHGHGTRRDQVLIVRAGQYIPHLSSPQVPGFTRFADAPSFAMPDRLESDPLLALNTMLAEDGVVLTVPDGADLGLVYLMQTGIAGTSGHPRHVIRLGQGARLTLVEQSLGEGRYLLNPVFDIQVAEDAALTHIRVLQDGEDAVNLTGIAVNVAARGQYEQLTMVAEGRITRTDIRASIDGPQARVHLDGVQLLKGTQHSDFTSVVRHLAPHGTSRQAVRSVLADRSHGVFQGRIEVARPAQKTDGYQRSSTLLLSSDAEMDTKPELEIFADDVKCSHGATVGALDAEQLFYLRSRGIPDTEARSLLIRAFLAEALEPVTNDEVRAMLEGTVDRWWKDRAA